MDPKQELTRLLTSSFRFQKIMFYGMGTVSALTGIGIIILSFVVPPEPGEATVVTVLQGASVIFVLFAFWCVWYVKKRIKKVTGLIFDNPKDVAVIKPFTVRSRGTAYAIRLYKKDGKMIGFNVTGPETQVRLTELLAKQIPSAKVEQ